MFHPTRPGLVAVGVATPADKKPPEVTTFVAPKMVGAGPTVPAGEPAPIQLIDTATGRMVAAFAPPRHFFAHDFAFSPGGTLLAAIVSDRGRDARVHVRDVGSGRLTTTVRGAGSGSELWAVGSSLGSLRGGSVLAVLRGPGLSLFDARTGRELGAEDFSRVGWEWLRQDGPEVRGVWADGNRMTVWLKGEVTHTWEPAQLFARASPEPTDLAPKPSFDPAVRAPDLVDRFRSPGESKFKGSVQDKNSFFSLDGGRYRMTLADGGWAGWSPVERKGDFAVRVTAKLSGGPADGWMLRVSRGKDPQNHFGVLVDGAGQVELVRLPEAEQTVRPPGCRS